MKMRWKAGALVALLALAGCEQKKAGSGSATATAEDTTAAELARFQAEENARSQVTMVDAATADAAAMPAEWSGPSEPEPGVDNKQAAVTKPPGNVAADRAEPTVPEEFPSVAE